MRSTAVLITTTILATALIWAPIAVQANNAFRMFMQPHTRDCYFEPMKIGDVLDVSFQVLDGGNLDVDFW
ncbi:hypothetical protein HDV05_001799, partial [Chytridiales sp. JEL 0842]